MEKHKTTWMLAAALATAVLAAVAGAGEPRTVEVTVTDDGYQPARIELVAGEPARLAFHNEADSSCAASVRSEALGIETTDLPKGETTVIEVTPQKAGEYTFTCGMGILEGAVIVEAPGAGHE
jgi:plastocyanin domain-containing protein